MKAIIQKLPILLTALLSSLLLTVNSYASGTTNPSQTVTEIPQQCKKLFQATEQLIADAEKQPGTHTQVNKIKNKLNQSKKQILEMELTTQIKSCDQGLAKLNLDDKSQNN